MKDFLKFTLATITGLMLVGAILTFFSIVVLVGLIASSEPTVQVKPNSVFVLNLNKPLSERAVEDPITMLMGEDYASIGLNEVLTSIKKAKEEANITGIYLEASGYSDASPAEWEEIRRALMNFKESGKFIVAYGDNYSQGEYYLCSVADKVILNPQGSIEWTGISSQPIFYKRLLEKIGVTMNIFKVGTYKSAIEPFIATEMSEANREQTHAYLNSIWTRITEDIATSRSISTKDLNKYADEMIALSPTERFIEAGMADTLLYKDEVKEYLKKLTHTNSHQSLNTLSLKEMKAIEEVAIFPKNEGRIAVYYAVGEVMDDIPGGTFSTEECIVGSQTIKELSQLREDDQVKAVVLRVNSPGGSAFASEQIWNEVVKLKAKKPVIVSMGGMAASGGYYISCAADSIFAEATTLTGSIGIFGIPVWCLCRCSQSHFRRRENILSLILLRTLLPTTACIHLLAAREVISVSISSAIITPVAFREPCASPVAMSMACLQASTQSSWQTTSKSPVAVFITACLRAPTEFFHSQRTSPLTGIFLLSFTFRAPLSVYV